MIPALKSEVRKLLSIRSTYVILAFALLLEIFVQAYAIGYKGDPQSFLDRQLLAGSVTTALSFLAVFISLPGLLGMTHEYRYNTIMYTLTAAKNRSLVLLAKILTISAFAIVVSLVLGFLSPLLVQLGANAAGHTMASQSIPYSDIWWRVVVIGWGFAMIALLLATIIRIQAGTLVMFILFPSTIEPLIGVLLKDNSKYLPFSALQQLGEGGSGLSYAQAALTVTIYVVVGWLIAWALFLRRDAN